MRIFINPGHGQGRTYDPGAVGPTGLKEADITAAIGKKLSAKLLPYCTVNLCQTGGTSADLQTICNLSNQWGADYFVSLHSNGFSNPSANGIETWYFTGSTRGRGLAQSIQNELVKALGRTNRGLKVSIPGTSGLYILRYTNAPAALAEIGFITNPTEEALMKTEPWKEAAAEALALGICGYLGIQYRSTPGQPLPETPGTEETSYKEPTVLIQKGSVGDGVKWVQESLNTVVGAGLDVDGDFGWLTDTAVRNFQRDKGLSVDGCVGPNTRAALTCPYSEPAVELQKGSLGNDVKWVQWYLNKKGYGLVVDGDFGTDTHKSVIAFQKNWGLSQDGIVGPLTRKTLKNS